MSYDTSRPTTSQPPPPAPSPYRPPAAQPSAGSGEGFFARRARRKAETKRQAALADAAAAVAKAEDARRWASLESFDDSVPGVVLKAGEVAYAVGRGVSLIEPRKAPGGWVGGSHGVSIRVAKGVSYRVGGHRGRYVPGEETPTVIDEGGVFVVTSKRCFFAGGKHTREWRYANLVGFSLEGAGVAVFQVTNRQKASGVFYGADAENAFDAVIAGAVARFQGEGQHRELLAELDQGVAEARAALVAVERGQHPG